MSERLLANLPSLTLYLVDRWEPPKEGDSYLTSGSIISQSNQEIFDSAKAETLLKVARFADRSVVLQLESEEAARKFPAHYFDFVFIDADHSYEGCKRDIGLWLPKVKKEGWIGGHDYAHPDQGGVEKAVLESFDTVEVDDNRTWFVRVK